LLPTLKLAVLEVRQSELRCSILQRMMKRMIVHAAMQTETKKKNLSREKGKGRQDPRVKRKR
jgi:hypothetical protein